MRLRNLELKDADLMLEWMHDGSVVGNLQTNFAVKTIKDCQDFIEKSRDDNDNIHLAITDDNDTYMGTVSLKHIRKEAAEFAIVIRKNAMGKGYSIRAMRAIILIGFEKLGIKNIYWCVATNNFRALRFYDKNKFRRASIDEINITGEYTNEQIEAYVWYQINNFLP